MLWTVLLIVGVIGLVKFPALRKAALVVVGVLALAILVYVMRDKQQTQESKTLVRADQLDFEDLRLGPDYGSAYKLSGRVKNNSQYSVFAIKAKVQVLDCDDKSHCEVVGEKEQDIAPLVPPGQVRDIDETVYFDSAMRIRGQFQWNYTITEVQARR